MMKAAICYIVVYYLTVKPFKLFQPSAQAARVYNDVELKSRFPSVFQSWREYENVQ